MEEYELKILLAGVLLSIKTHDKGLYWNMEEKWLMNITSRPVWEL